MERWQGGEEKRRRKERIRWARMNGAKLGWKFMMELRWLPPNRGKESTS